MDSWDRRDWPDFASSSLARESWDGHGPRAAWSLGRTREGGRTIEHVVLITDPLLKSGEVPPLDAPIEGARTVTDVWYDTANGRLTRLRHRQQTDGWNDSTEITYGSDMSIVPPPSGRIPAAPFPGGSSPSPSK